MLSTLETYVKDTILSSLTDIPIQSKSNLKEFLDTIHQLELDIN
jgi:hypothetical protein